MYRRSIGKLATLTFPIVLLSACALNGDKNPHNDVLVFATQTKFGIDISAPLNSATLPQINVGYNRSEAVWMPLRPNGTKGGSQTDAEQDLLAKLNACDQRMQSTISDGKNRQAFCLSATLPAGKYVSMASGVRTEVGGTGLEIDTYSVFASFGARGSVSGSSANGGLAQIFATGIAAQRLASNPQVGQVLNTGAAVAVAAEAKAKEAEAKTEQAAIAAFGQSATAGTRASELAAITKLNGPWKCGDPQSDPANFNKIITQGRASNPDGDWDYVAAARDLATARSRLKGATNGTMETFVSEQTTVCGG
jgi:hypothetical protein